MIYKYQARNRDVALTYAAHDLETDVNELNVVKVKKNFGTMQTETVMIRLNSKIESMVIDFLEHTLGYMGVDFSTDFVAKREDKQIWISIDAEMPALLIGNKGKTLDALQLLANMYLRRITDKDLRIVLDVHDYRDRRVSQVKKMVYQAITDIRNGEESVLLDPMNAFERQLVHRYIDDSRGLTTKSENEGDQRCVRIFRDQR